MGGAGLGSGSGHGPVAVGGEVLSGHWGGAVPAEDADLGAVSR